MNNMNKHILLAIMATLLLASCSPSAKQKAAEIDKLETELKDSSKKNVADTTKVKQLLADYRYYIKNFPTDSLSPKYMMTSARFYDFISLPDSAIAYYHDVYTNFPTFPKANLALFSEAFIYGNEKQDLSKAGQLYKDYLAKYPNTSLAKSAAMELNNLGKTPEQIMAELDSMKSTKQDTSKAEASASKGK
jgi:outer membrane murein-binding lipoprotein Lpp